MVELGKRYKDSITEFEGVATSRTVYLNGCVRIGLEGKGKPGEAIFFDEPRLVATSPATAGGPMQTPPSQDPR